MSPNARPDQEEGDYILPLEWENVKVILYKST